MELLKQKLNDNIKTYVDLFCEKHDLYFDYWVVDTIGGTACLSNEYYVDFLDIKFDLEEEIEDGEFTEWYHYSLDEVLEGRNYINYQSYLKGAR